MSQAVNHDLTKVVRRAAEDLGLEAATCLQCGRVFPPEQQLIHCEFHHCPLLVEGSGDRQRAPVAKRK